MQKFKGDKHASNSLKEIFPHVQHVLGQWMGPESNFIPELVEQHVREAHAYAEECKQNGTPLLDPCGPRGDLYFILKALVHNGELSA